MIFGRQISNFGLILKSEMKINRWIHQSSCILIHKVDRDARATPSTQAAWAYLRSLEPALAENVFFFVIYKIELERCSFL